VARQARFGAAGRVARPAIVDGGPGLVATEDGAPVAVLAFTVAGARVTAIDALGDPARIAALGLDAVLAGSTPEGG
jgi:RNA polymerase sigma-70 factor (ECF subfamily)